MQNMRVLTLVVITVLGIRRRRRCRHRPFLNPLRKALELCRRLTLLISLKSCNRRRKGFHRRPMLGLESFDLLLMSALDLGKLMALLSLKQMTNLRL